MIRWQPFLGKPLQVAAILLAASTPIFRAHALMIDLTATPLGGGVFGYEVSVTNDEAEDVILASIVDAPILDPLIGGTLFTPGGFLSVYDPGLGIVDLLEFTGNFAAGTTTSGFGFQSLAGPATNFKSYEAFTISFNFLSGSINQTVNPGPGSLPDSGATGLLLGLSFLVFAGVAQRLTPINHQASPTHPNHEDLSTPIT